MPIDIDTFENSSEDDLGNGPSQPEQVLSFLVAHPQQAFKATELAHRLDIPQNSIGTVLRRLEARTLVRHKGEYWAITDDMERLRSLTQYQAVTETANDLYGEEDPREWVAHMPSGETSSDADGK